MQVSGLLRDLRYAARGLRRAPLVFWTAVLTLAAGIGSSTGVLAVAYGVLLRPLPYADPDQLVVVELRYRSDGRGASIGFGEFEAWRDRVRVFEALAAHGTADFTLRGAGDPRSVRAAMITDGFFETMRLAAAEGSAAAITRGVPAIAVSSRLAEQLGRAGPWREGGLTVGAESFAVAAVMPPAFAFPSDAVDVWVRADAVPEVPLFGSPDQRRFQLIGRLAPGVSIEQARDDVRRVAGEIDDRETLPRQRDATVERLQDLLRGEARGTVLPFVAGSVLVLLIACANVSGLLVGRSVGRAREFAVRRALGGRLGEILRASLSESLIVALCGWALGLWLAHGVTAAFTALAAGSIPNLTGARLSPGIVVASFFLTLGVAAASGAAPALRAARADVNAVLKRATSRAGGGGLAVRRALVVGQIALTMVLLVSAGLLTRTVQRIVAAERGFATDQAIAVRLMLAQTARFELAERAPFVDRLVREVRRLPGVVAAGVGSDLPPAGTQLMMTIRIVGESRDEQFELNAAVATPGYLEALGATIVTGRLLDERDRHASPPGVVITETAARMMFSDREPVGREWPALLPGPRGKRVKPMVIGVIRDIRYGGLDRDPRATLFASWEHLAPGNAHLVVRTAGHPGAIAPAVRRIVQELDPTLPLFPPQTLEEVVSGSLAARHLRLRLAVAFAALALVLAVVALWGVVAQSVLDRRHELAVRLALGASRAAAVRMMLRTGLGLVAAGVLLGTIAGAWTGRTIHHLLHGVSPSDPVSFVSGGLIVLCVAAVACYVPARRAAAISPAELLRDN